MASLVELYRHLRADARLQRDWEQNQPRRDRALESVLIARCSREVATAVLLTIKLRYEPAAVDFLQPPCPADLVAFGQRQGAGGSRLVSCLAGAVPEVVRAAAIHSLHYYRDRAGPNPLVRLPWSDAGLRRLQAAPCADIILPELRPSSAERKSRGVRDLARVLLVPQYDASDRALRQQLRAIPGLGPERADYVGVFFSRGWPIVDEYLWRLLRRHGLLSQQQSAATSYAARRRHFEALWQTLLAAEANVTPGEVAATLHLWACEAERFQYEYAGQAQ